jgi:hypothetical protein
MVACDDDRIFSNKFNPFDWFIPNLLDGLTRGPISTMPRVVALGVILISCHKYGSHATMLAFFPNRLDLLVRVTPNLLDGRGAISTTPKVVALGVISISCHKHGSLVMMLAFFPNWLDPLDRVMSNWLDGLLLGATSTTSRVAAPRVVSVLSLQTWMTIQSRHTHK